MRTSTPEVTGLVLAGGQGSRMGGVDKGLQPFRGRPMVAHVIERLAPQVDELLINANRNSDEYARFGHRVIADEIAGFAGPLAGFERGLVEHVYVDETRPLLQGARLTAFELESLGIPHTVIADSAAAWLMSRGEIDCVITGADRIAANGDSANKIGTYSLAVNAAHHGLPLYVVAPTSTIDPDTPDGDGIPIEERDGAEVTARFAARNPAFDVTPAELIAAIVTEQGIHEPPYPSSLPRVTAA